MCCDVDAAARAALGALRAVDPGSLHNAAAQDRIEGFMVVCGKQRATWLAASYKRQAGTKGPFFRLSCMCLPKGRVEWLHRSCPISIRYPDGPILRVNVRAGRQVLVGGCARALRLSLRRAWHGVEESGTSKPDFSSSTHHCCSEDLLALSTRTIAKPTDFAQIHLDSS